MTKWATVDSDKLFLEVAKLDKQIEAICGYPPEQITRAKIKGYNDAIKLARLMGTRDALVHVHNCLSVGTE